MLKVGLIGAGFMGKMHSTCYEALIMKDVKIVAVADLVTKNAKDIAKKHNAKIYTDGMELIKNADVDIIDICLPTYLHTIHAVAAMEKKRDVFIEKPVCLNKEQAKLLLETEKETGVKVMVGQCIRLWSEYAYLKKIIDNNTYGSIITGNFKRISPLPTWSWNNWLHKPELSGSVALDMHIHDVDYIRYIMGEPIKINAIPSRDSNGVIQQMFSTYTYQNSIISTEVCWDYPSNFPFCMEYRVKFEKATIVYNSTIEPSLIVYPKEGNSFVPKLDDNLDSNDDIGGNISSLGGYYNELNYFIEHIISDKQIKIAPLSEGVKSVLLTLKEIDIAGGTKL